MAEIQTVLEGGSIYRPRQRFLFLEMKFKGFFKELWLEIKLEYEKPTSGFTLSPVCYFSFQNHALHLGEQSWKALRRDRNK